MQKKELFRAEYITKSFEGANLVEGCTLSVYKGEVRGIVGLNASNQEVLVDVFAGVQRPDEGRMFLEEEDYAPDSRRDAEECGVFYIGSDLGLQYGWDIYNNLSIMPHKKRKIIIRKKHIDCDIQELLDIVALDKKADCLVAGLTPEEQRKVSVARALSRHAKLIILNFPWEMYTIQERIELKRMVSNLKEREIAILLIGSAYELLIGLCDCITIMRNGMVIGNFEQEDFDHQKIANTMLGYEFAVTSRPPQHIDIRQNTVIRAEEMSDTLTKKFSFQIHEGEIVSIIDAWGNGATEIAELLSGRKPLRYGTLLVKEQPTCFRSVQKAVQHGIYYIPETESASLLIPNFSIEENITASVVKRYAHFAGAMNHSEIKKAAARFEEKLQAWQEWDFDLLSLNLLDETEKKRVILFRYMIAQPLLIIMNAFTRGLDMVAKGQIYEDVRDAAASGCSVLFITPNISEAIEIGNRILICGGDSIIAEIGNNEVDDIRAVESMIQDIMTVTA